jgi:ParB family chromosome partitioning protein
MIDPDANQPRRYFDPQFLQELADSLVANGQIVPITVRPVGDRFVIVQGERRWRAAQLAGLTSLRAEVSAISEEEAYLLALVENVQRADLSPTEEARAYQQLVDAGYTQTALAKRIGKTQSYIAQKIRLLSMPEAVQTLLDDGRLSEGHGRQLLRLEDAEAAQELAERAVADDRTVDHLWHDVTLHLLVTKPSRNHKFKDLAEFADKLKPYENGGKYAEHCVRTYFAAGDILNFCERVWEEYKLPPMAIAMIKEMSLADIWALKKLDEGWNRTGHDMRNAMELASLPDDSVDAIIAQIFSDHTERESLDVQRELFDMVHTEIVSRNIVVGISTTAPMNAVSEVPS